MSICFSNIFFFRDSFFLLSFDVSRHVRTHAITMFEKRKSIQKHSNKVYALLEVFCAPWKMIQNPGEPQSNGRERVREQTTLYHILFRNFIVIGNEVVFAIHTTKLCFKAIIIKSTCEKDMQKVTYIQRMHIHRRHFIP